MTDKTLPPPELLPCPFCGDPMMINGTLIAHREKSDCPIRLQAWDESEADRWNRRAPTPQPNSGGDPIDAIKVMMEERGLTNVDLYDIFGAKSRTSEILRRKRPLRVHHIQQLHERFGLPLAKLIEPYALEEVATDIEGDGDDA